MILASLVQKTLITKNDGKHLQTRTVVVVVDGIIVFKVDESLPRIFWH